MSTMRTLFLNPPSFSGFDGGAGARYQARREIKSFWYPTWLAQPAALIPTSKLIDAPADDLTLDQVLQSARGFELCVIHTSTPSFDNDAKVADALKKQNPDMKIGFVGAHVAVLPGESLKNAPVLDFVGREEFDYTIKEVAEGRSLDSIAGLSYRKADGEIVHNPDRMLIDDMDALPSVLDVYKRDLVVPNYYIGYLKHPYLSIYTGRGCPARCSFCLWPQTVGGHVYRTKSAQAVIAEMAKAKQMFPQVKEFFFDDDTFTADLTRAAEIAKGLGKLGIMWSCNSRANVPYEYLKVFKDNGLRLLLVGYESGNQQILHNIKKGMRIEVAKKFTKDCHDLGIIIHGTFILGLPGETRQSLKETIDMVFSLGLSTCQVSVATPLPGTPFYDSVVKNGWLATTDWSQFEGTATPVLEYPGCSRQDLADALDEVVRRKVRMFLSDPANVALHLVKLLKHHGLRGFCKDLAKKGRYTLGALSGKK